MTAVPEKVVREIRINPIVPSESVLVATARSMRPKKAEELAPRDTRKHVETCPFCRGNEHKTPPLILSWPETGDWQIRMVENLYPVLGDDRAQTGFTFGLQQTIDGIRQVTSGAVTDENYYQGDRDRGERLQYFPCDVSVYNHA